jgi:hypothetical protein
MYSILSRYLPGRVAGTLTAFWYVFLALLVLYYGFLPSGQFRYAHW